MGTCARGEGGAGPAPHSWARGSKGTELVVAGATAAGTGETGCWGAPHSSGSLARLFIFLLFTLPPPPLSLISHSQFSSSSTSSSASCPPFSGIPRLCDWPVQLSTLSKMLTSSSWPFLFFFRLLLASPPSPTLSGLRGSEPEELGLLSSIESLGERKGAAEGGEGFYKRRNQSHTVSENHLPKSQ